MDERIAYLLKRTLSLFIAVFLVANAIFFLMFIANSDSVALLAPKTDPIQRQDVIEDLRLNDPIPAQYVNYMKKMFTGQFFLSTGVVKYAPIHDFVFDALAYTLILLVPTTLLSAALGILLELPFRRSTGGLLDRIFQVGMALLFCIPVIAGGLAVLWLNVMADSPLPLHGHASIEDGNSRSLASFVEHAMLPVFCGVLASFAGFSIITRSSYEKGGATQRMHGNDLDRLEQIRSQIPSRMPSIAAAKFLLPWVVTIVAVTDSLFSYGGLGDLFTRSMWTRDFPTLMVSVFLLGTLAAVVSYVFDITVLFERSSRSKSLSANARPASSATTTIPPASGPLKHRPVLVEFTRSKTGLAALALFLCMLIVAVAAPWLSTVADPVDARNLEPNLLWGDPGLLPQHSEWLNPHPPSMIPSPYTDYLHPLGTDEMGRDVYSMLVYGALDGVFSVVLVAGASLLAGSIVWFFASMLAGQRDIFSRVIEFAGLTAAEFVIAMPLVLLGSMILIVVGWNWQLVRLSFVVLAFAFALPIFYFRARVSGLDRTLPGSKEQVNENLASWRNKNMFGGRMWVEVFHAAKITTVIGFISILVIQFIGLSDPNTITLGGMLMMAYEYNAIANAWWAIIPVGFVAMILPWSVYLIMDTFERIFSRRILSDDSRADL